MTLEDLLREAEAVAEAAFVFSVPSELPMLAGSLRLALDQGEAGDLVEALAWQVVDEMGRLRLLFVYQQDVRLRAEIRDALKISA